MTRGLRGVALLALGALVAVLSAWLGALGAPLVTAAAPQGIVSYEFARDAATAGAILASWDSVAREKAMLIQGIDMLYLLAYPAFLSLACRALGDRLGGRFWSVGAPLSLAVLLAAPLDAAENLALIRQLEHGPSEGAAALAAFAAGPKFALVALASLFLLAGLGALGVRALRGSGDRVATTHATYDVAAERFRDRVRDRTATSPWAARFAERVAPGGLVLDLGGGPGFDAAEFRARGLRAVTADLSLGMLRAGLDDWPGSRVQADLRRLPFEDGCAEGVWANACLLHLDPHGVREALAEIHRVLRPGCPLHLSVKDGRGSAWESSRLGRPRWFHYWRAEAFDAVLHDAGFEAEGAWHNRTKQDTWHVRQVTRRGA